MQKQDDVETLKSEVEVEWIRFIKVRDCVIVLYQAEKATETMVMMSETEAKHMLEMYNKLMAQEGTVTEMWKP